MPSPFRALLALLPISVAACSGGTRDVPDIVVITIDTLRADRLPFHGFDPAVAPFLAELARDSVVFENAWAASSWTAPSTAALFTGVYTTQHGVVMGKIKMTEKARIRYGDFDLTRIPDALQTMPEFVRSRGYATFGIADNGNICEELGFARGFNRFQSTVNKGAGQVNETLAAWAPAVVDRDPFFVYLHYMDPHAPYEGHAPHYRPAISPDRAVRDLARYDSEIHHVDQHIREALAMLGDWRDLVIVVLADHGEEFGDHGGFGHKFQLYSELTHVPLLIHVPGLEPRGRRIAADVSLVDVLPTLGDLLGAAPSADHAGTSLVPYWLGERLPPPRPIFSERRMLDEAQPVHKTAVIADGYKYVHTEPPGQRELYDLRVDPGELNDLTESLPERAEQLHGYWREFAARAPRWQGAPAAVEFSEEEKAALEALGYVGER